MAVIGIDLGATKLALAIFTEEGKIVQKKTVFLGNKTGEAVGELIITGVQDILSSPHIDSIDAIGIAVPGISRIRTGTVWAPNIPGWEDYPLRNEIRKSFPSIPVLIESDRACCILGEKWQGNAKGCKDVIYLAVGTGIGAGILIEGDILHGANDIAGAIGWMALNKPFDTKYISCGCFEYHASGSGIAKVASQMVNESGDYRGSMKKAELSAQDVFNAYDLKDKIATTVINDCIQYWGMAVANLVSLFNPEKVIFGGGIFGPATKLIPLILEESRKWAQPISITQITIEPSALKEDSALYGAAFMALQKIGVV